MSKAAESISTTTKALLYLIFFFERGGVVLFGSVYIARLRVLN